MTNGEKIKQVFPDLQIDMGELEVYMWTTTHDAIDIPLEWWDKEYKEPNHIADAGKMIEPTTKTCKTCRNFGSHHGICEICKDNKCWTEKEPTTRNCFGCKYSKDNHNAGTEECHLCMWENQYTPTTKNDLAVDCISRADALRVAKNEYLRGWHDALCKALSEKYSIHCEEGNFRVIQEETVTGLGLSMNCALGKDVESYMSTMPSVTPQEPQSFKWCTDCKEYDQEKHCCHRYSKVIRDTVAEMKQEQEPILDKIQKMKSEIADSLEFWDYSPNNNPLARDMLETLTYFWGDMREVNE